MPSIATTRHLEVLLEDAAELSEAHRRLRTGNRGRQWGLGAINRAAVVICVSAWEAYVEEVTREALEAIRPAALGQQAWDSIKAPAMAQIRHFNTPNAGNTKALLSSCVGLGDVTTDWYWRNCAAATAVRYLNAAITERHQIAHGVNPRPRVPLARSSWLSSFFRNLARCTDRSVARHVVTLGYQAPW